MKKLSKNAKRAARVIIAAAAFAAVFTADKVAAPPLYITLPLYGALYLFIGYDVLIKAVRGIFGGQVFDENLLMFVAGAGAFAIGEYPEAVAVMVFYQVGELFQSLAVGRSRASISALMAISPDTATVIRSGEELEVLPEDVAPGECVVVRAGQRVPVDGTVVKGYAALDLSALTGEAMPVDAAVGTEVLSGSIASDGVITVRCDKAYGQSTAARILELVENASARKAKTENFITRFAAVYTPTVVGLAAALAIIPPLFLGMGVKSVWLNWLYRALTFLVVSCPCALVISVPLAFFGAIGGASASGILIKGGAALERAEKTTVCIMDKTGTVTEAGFAVTGVFGDEKEVMRAAAIAESGSRHPLARAIVEAHGEEDTAGYEYSECAGGGIVARKNDDVITAGNPAFLEKSGIAVPSAARREGTAVYVARNGKFLGAVSLGSKVKPDSAAAVTELKGMGVKCVMLTGDSLSAAEKVAREVGIDEYRAGLLPADKVEEMSRYLGGKGKVAFVGDGINDAPVLAAADLGIAMGGVGSDSAIEAADVVLMNDSLAAVPRLKRIAKKAMCIARINIIFALAVKVAALVLTAAGITGMWLAIFADVGVTVLAVLNSMRMLKKVK